MGTAAPRPVMLIPLLVAGATFMELLDGTVIVTALPAMARSFHVAPVDLNLGMTAYILTLAVMIPVSGWIAERHGARNVFGVAILIFTLASILCAFTDGIWSFTAARVLQGFGGALMVPVGRLIVLRRVEKQDLVRATAYITWPALMAPVLGPALGGFITSYASWRWIFYLNVPIGIFGLLCTWALIDNARTGVRDALDWLGFMLIGAACVCLVYGLSLIGQTTGDWRIALLLLLGSGALAWAALAHSRRHPTPLLDLGALRIRTYGVGVRGGSILRTAISAIPFLLPLLFQLGFGMKASTSGLLLLTLFVGNLGIKPATTPLLRRFGFRNILLVNGLILAASFAAMSGFTANTPVVLMVVVMVISGAARSMQFTALGTIAFADVPKSGMTGANTFFSLVTQLSNGIGVAVAVLALRGATLLTGAHAAALTVADFHIAFLAIAALSLLGLLDSLGLAPDAGAVVSRHRRYSV